MDAQKSFYSKLYQRQQTNQNNAVEKKGKDRNYLENWRPISITNVDAKIASKVIAARIIPVLPDIITSTQTGYVKGRFIGEAVGSIIDVMDYTPYPKMAAILVFFCLLAN